MTCNECKNILFSTKKCEICGELVVGEIRGHDAILKFLYEISEEKAPTKNINFIGDKRDEK